MRKTLDYIIQNEGRDKGKVFALKEAPASKVFAWATRVYSALEKQGIDVGGLSALGVQGLLIIGLRGMALLPPFELKPLLDEMMECVVGVRPDTRNPNVLVNLVNDGSDNETIEEPRTHFELRNAIAELHLGFSLAGAVSTNSETSTTEQATPPASSSTPTSPRPSQPRFHQVKRP